MEPASNATLTPVAMGPGVRRDDALLELRLARRAELLGQHEKLPRAGDVGPVAVEVGHQPLQVIAIHRPVKRGLVGELVGRLMQRGIADAPETPGLFDAERLRRVGRCSLLYHRSKAARLAGSVTVARTTK